MAKVRKFDKNFLKILSAYCDALVYDRLISFNQYGHHQQSFLNLSNIVSVRLFMLYIKHNLTQASFISECVVQGCYLTWKNLEFDNLGKKKP